MINDISNMVPEGKGTSKKIRMEAPNDCQLACIAHQMRESNYCPKLLFIPSGEPLLLILHNRDPM